MLVITRHRVPQSELQQWLVDAKAALAPLGSQTGCRAVRIGLSVDEAELVCIQSEWDGIGAYRRALSSFEVKANSIPFLSTAIDEPSAFEVVFAHVDGVVSEKGSDRAFDADSIGLGFAAGPDVPNRGE